jgi:hypothetical protein
MEERERERG